jgi:CheY-like chemotaxis protein
MVCASILVVDDLPELLELTSSILEGEGYEVLRCKGDAEALTIVNDGHAVDLLLTDVRMPGEIDGFELARRARLVRPALLVAYLTGYVSIRTDVARETFGPILRKPYRPRELLQQIETLIAQAEDAKLVRSVASEMIGPHANALDRATEAAELARASGDELSADEWRDIAGEVAAQLKQRDGRKDC